MYVNFVAKMQKLNVSFCSPVTPMYTRTLRTPYVLAHIDSGKSDIAAKILVPCATTYRSYTRCKGCAKFANFFAGNEIFKVRPL